MVAGCAKEKEEEEPGASHIRSIKTISKDINLNYGHTTWNERSRRARTRANFEINFEGGDGVRDGAAGAAGTGMRSDVCAAKCFPIITDNFKRFAGDRASSNLTFLFT